MDKFVYSPEMQKRLRKRRLKNIQENAIMFWFIGFELFFFFLMLIPDFRCNYGMILGFPLILANIVYTIADWYDE